jgi:glutamyl-Q tRNA(Asp) synthetase
VTPAPRSPRGRYRGRFAPSPTGPLHFGSLVAAVASYLDARAAGGDWLVRIEDLDPPREAPGSADQIVRALEAFGFEWTESIVRQSTRTDLYADAVARLVADGRAFPCSCSRTELQSAQPRGPRPEGEELRYPGWCRNGVRAPERPLAIRFRAPDGAVCFEDRIQGGQRFDVAAETGDFVIRRRDGLYAYQLAVVVDDAAEGVTHVVRGCDLLSSTPRQIAVQGVLRLPTPEYAHVPVVTDANGIKLSKSTGAAAINPDRPVSDLHRALRFLRQAPPAELASATVGEVWQWAINHWRVQPLYGLRCGVIDSS